MMTKSQKRAKLNWFLLMLGYFTFGYMAINRITSHRSKFFDLSLAFERNIPFILPFILGYSCVYGGMFLAFAVIDRMDEWRRAIICFFLATTTCYLIFLLMPVQMNMRPDVSDMSGIYAAIAKIIFSIDLPYNCFPSLHVAYPTFAAIVVWKNHRKMRWVIAAMALIVAISVILVKQHYIADVVAGVIVAFGSFWITVRTENLWSRWFRTSD